VTNYTENKAQYDYNVEQHDFVVIAPPGLPESWLYITVSDDDDDGEVLDYRWITPEQIMGVHPAFAPTITPGNMPELFTHLTQAPSFQPLLTTCLPLRPSGRGVKNRRGRRSPSP